MDLVRKLNILGKEVNERYPYINHGGCCVYAAMIVAALRKHGIDAKGIVASYNAAFHKRNIDEIRQNIQKNSIHEWQNNGISFSHVGVEFKYGWATRHYDSNGVHKARRTLDGMKIYEGRMEYKELRGLAAKRDGWNNTFNRRDIPELRRLVKRHLAVDKAPV